MEARIIDGELISVEDLIEKHKPLIHLKIRKFQRRRLSGVIDWEDLWSIAYEAAIIAFKKFDASKGVKFTTVLDIWLKHRMTKELVSSEILYIPHGSHMYLEQVRVNGDTHLNADDIMLKYECKAPTARAIEQYFRYSFHSIHAQKSYGSDSYVTFDELIGFEPDHTSLIVGEFLELLTTEQIELIQLRVNELTYQEIANVKGMTRQAIHQKINRIRQKWHEFEEGRK